jgi:heme/copper-type cytochrome/quinol oxidase subunit 2
MTENITKLNQEEMFELETLFDTSKRKAINTSIIIAIITFGVSIIPFGFLPNSRRLSSEDSSQNLIQLFSIGWWLIFFILVVGGFSYLVFLDKRIIKLKKDLEDGEKVELNVVVAQMYSDTTPEYYSMLVNNKEIKNQKIVLDKDQYRQFCKGQNIKIVIYKNSKILISYTH